MKSAWKMKGLVEKVNGNNVTINMGYDLLKPSREKNLVVISIEYSKNKDKYIKNAFLKIKGVYDNTLMIAKKEKVKYLLDDTYWSAPGPTVAGGPNSTADSSRQPSWKTIIKYYIEKLRRK